MTSEKEIENNWLEAFSDLQNLPRNKAADTFWEGELVYNELKRADALWVVFPENDELKPMFLWLTKKLFRELGVYSQYSDGITVINQEFKDALDAMRGVEHRLAEVEKRTAKRLKWSIKACVGLIRREIAEIEERKEAFWKEALNDFSSECPEIYVEDGGKLTRVITKEILQYKSLFARARYPERLGRRIDLDTRFQIRLGVILRSYLGKKEGVSLRTIARLVLLYYFCSGLVLVDAQNETRVRGTKRLLTVGAIDQRLRGAGLK